MDALTPLLGFDPVGGMIALLFIALALVAALIGLTIGGLNLFVIWRYGEA